MSLQPNVGEEFTQISEAKMRKDIAASEQNPIIEQKEIVPETPAEEKKPEEKNPEKTPDLPNSETTENTDNTEGQKSQVDLKKDEKGNVEFTQEMVKEISDKMKEQNPDKTDDELTQIVDEEKKRIDEQFGNQSEKEILPETKENTFGISQSVDGKDYAFETEKAKPVIDSYVKSITQDEFESLDSLINNHKELKEKEEFSFIHPVVKNLNDVLSKNPNLDEDSISNFLRNQIIDYDKLTEMELIAEIHRIDEPGISPEEVEVKLEKFIPILKKTPEELEEMIEDGEITKVKVNALKNEWERMGKNALNKLKKDQEKMKISLTPTSDQIEAEQKRVNSDTQKLIDAYNNQVDEKISNFTTDKIPIGKDGNDNQIFLDFNIDKESKGKIEATAKNINSFIADRYVDKDQGTVDFQKMFSDFNFMLNRDSILAAATAKIANQRKLDTVNEFNNYSFLEKSSGGSANTLPSEADQLAEQMNQKLF